MSQFDNIVPQDGDLTPDEMQAFRSAFIEQAVTVLVGEAGMTDENQFLVTLENEEGQYTAVVYAAVGDKATTFMENTVLADDGEPLDEMQDQAREDENDG